MAFAIRHKPTNRLLRANPQPAQDGSDCWYSDDVPIQIVETELTAETYPDTIWLVDRRDDADEILEKGKAEHGHGKPFISGFVKASEQGDKPLLGWQKSSDDYEVVEIKLPDYHWPEID